MSFIDYLIDNEWRQRRDIERGKEQSSLLGSQMDATNDDIAALRRRVTELSETVRVLLAILVEQHGLDESQFKDRLKASRPAVHAKPCSKCGQLKSDAEMMKVGADWWCTTCARNP